MSRLGTITAYTFGGEETDNEILCHRCNRFCRRRLVRELREQIMKSMLRSGIPEKAKELQDIGVKLFKGDVTDKESMREAMQGVDGVYHVAGWYKIGAKDKSDGRK